MVLPGEDSSKPDAKGFSLPPHFYRVLKGGGFRWEVGT